MCKLSLVVIEVLHLPLPSLGESSPYMHRLLMLANAWLQRRAAGFQDTVVLIGVGAASEDELRSLVAPLGLKSVVLRTINRQEEDDSDDVGDEVSALLTTYLRSEHLAAVPLAVWPQSFRDIGYPDDAWWLGIECLKGDSGPWSHSLAGLSPVPFRQQAATWEAVLSTFVSLDCQDTSMERLHAGLAVASLARWLFGFSAATGDQFFHFDYSDVASTCELDHFMLGLEASRHHWDDLESEIDERESNDLQSYAMRELLTSDRYFCSTALKEFFGGPAALFFSAHTSIWPKVNQPAGDACVELTSPEGEDIGELDSAWRFVADGDWDDIDDSV